MPTANYEVGGCIITKMGELTAEGGINDPDNADLLAQLKLRGYNGTVADLVEADNDHKLVIEIPREQFSDEAIENLRKIISSKATVIKKALLADSLPVDTTADKLSFPWFTLAGADGEADAYIRFVSALCGMVKTQKRIIAKEHKSENDKFIMRLFLIRLGFIGPEYKSARRILLRNLTGNSSWKDGRRRVVITDIKDSDTTEAISVNNLPDPDICDTEVAPYEK
jgi:hypothetical protein